MGLDCIVISYLYTSQYEALFNGKFVTGAPIITTDQMADWHAMMVSLTWNVQAWRRWIQENIDRAVNYQDNGNTYFC